ncbi:MAG: ferritin family protein [Deltaproteobacteria bacterium]|nr:ferritin family protein [Deltaproteobacteria bacterium]
MDPVHFTGKEVLAMAVRIEENGLKFYTDAGKESKNKDIKALFKTLAEEEGHHIKVFQDLKKLLGTEAAAEEFDSSAEDAALYLKALADTEVFTSPSGGKKLGREAGSEEEVLNIAIGMEKDSILFYYEIQRMIREKDKKVIEELIEQEKDHLRKLTELKAGI